MDIDSGDSHKSPISLWDSITKIMLPDIPREHVILMLGHTRVSTSDQNLILEDLVPQYGEGKYQFIYTSLGISYICASKSSSNVVDNKMDIPDISPINCSVLKILNKGQFFWDVCLSNLKGPHILFPKNGHQPSLEDTITYSCADVDTYDLESPITKWYMYMFGYESRVCAG